MIDNLISIICCYRTEEAWNVLKASLQASPEDHVEFIGVDNRLNEYSLPEAYNTGRQESQGAILVFVHDDVEFLHKDWLSGLREMLRDNSIGIVGSAGGAEFFDAPATWWFRIGRNIPLRNMQEQAQGKIYDYHDCDEPQEVFCLDGFILMCRRSTIDAFHWSNSIGKWHGYDLDVCLFAKCLASKRNVLYPDVFARHKSLGTLDANWAHAMINVWNKYRTELIEVNHRSSSILARIQFINWTHQYPSVGIALKKSFADRQEWLWHFISLMTYSRTETVKLLSFRFLSIWQRILGSG